MITNHFPFNCCRGSLHCFSQEHARVLRGFSFFFFFLRERFDSAAFLSLSQLQYLPEKNYQTSQQWLFSNEVKQKKLLIANTKHALLPGFKRTKQQQQQKITKLQVHPGLINIQLDTQPSNQEFQNYDDGKVIQLDTFFDCQNCKDRNILLFLSLLEEAERNCQWCYDP